MDFHTRARATRRRLLRTGSGLSAVGCSSVSLHRRWAALWVAFADAGFGKPECLQRPAGKIQRAGHTPYAGGRDGYHRKRGLSPAYRQASGNTIRDRRHSGSPGLLPRCSAYKRRYPASQLRRGATNGRWTRLTPFFGKLQFLSNACKDVAWGDAARVSLIHGGA